MEPRQGWGWRAVGVAEQLETAIPGLQGSGAWRGVRFRLRGVEMSSGQQDRNTEGGEAGGGRSLGYHPGSTGQGLTGNGDPA